jgi:hypothetical protein
LVRKFSSQKDPRFNSYPGGPSPDKQLTGNKGVNRFVWDLRYPTMTGLPTAYIESSFAGHKVAPGKYGLTLVVEDQKSQSYGEVLPNPLYELTDADYQAYHQFMSAMEQHLNDMHQMVNLIMDYQKQLAAFLDRIEGKENYKNLHMTGTKLLKEMKAWDEEMVQRKSKAYDDVENFPNKFSANYMFLINQTESHIPKVNEGSRKRKLELETEWESLKKAGNEFIKISIPTYNQQLHAAGVGVLFVE